MRFGGFVALEDAGISVGPGEMVGLIGPNGAGKTTLFNVITGLVAEDEGTVRLGEPTSAPRRRTASPGRPRPDVPEPAPVPDAVGPRERRARRAQRPPLPAGAAAPDPDALLAGAGLGDLAERPAGTLDYGNQRRLELARAAAMAPDYLLLDEPTSGMSDDESLAMVERVRETAGGIGAGVLVIDHDLAFITRISDRVVVLAEGRPLAEGTPDEVRADPAVARAYLGRDDLTI